MNDLVFEGVVSDIQVTEFENRYHEADDRCEFIVTEDEGLHPYRQSTNFGMYGNVYKKYIDRIYPGARVRVHFSFTGVNTSMRTGRRYNRVGVWSVEEVL